MNRKMIASILGKVLCAEALLMLPSVIVGLIYREAETLAFLPAIGILMLLFLVMGVKKPEDTSFYARDGFFVVAAAWILLSLAGAVPLYLSGCFKTVPDAIFEIVSGFTTTGATILTEVESLPRCILFWRSFSHWLGGMGVLVFVLAIVPLSEERSLHIMRAEAPGPSVGKLVPRMKDTAIILYGVYTAMTVLLIILLLVGKMPLFDAVCNAFATAGTGGFAVRNAGIAAYNSAYIEILLAVFMVLFGINFNLYYFILIGRAKEAFRNEELHVYLGIVIGSTLLITLNILSRTASFSEALRQSFFQVSAIITTTGFATVDFTKQWPEFSQHILLLLMLIGASAGSTGGGLKVSRLMLLVKCSVQELRRLIHPNLTVIVRMDGHAVDEATVHDTRTYFNIYVMILIATTLLLSLNGFDFATNLSAAITCFNNIGPGISRIGPMDNCSIFSGGSKLLLSLVMLLGRLEIFPIIVLFSPSAWRKKI